MTTECSCGFLCDDMPLHIVVGDEKTVYRSGTCRNYYYGLAKTGGIVKIFDGAKTTKEEI